MMLAALRQSRLAFRRGKRSVSDAAEAVRTRALGFSLPDRIEALRPPPNALGLDAFGFDPSLASRVLSVGALVYRHYFRVTTVGLENVPQGPVILAANHGGQLPFDGLMVGLALALDAEPPRLVRSAVDRFVATLPYLSALFARAGQFVGHPDNARLLLERGEAVLVFPEGAAGMLKPFRNRYRLQPFGRGFARLAIDCGVPIVPVAVVGSEEQYVSLGLVRTFFERFDIPGFPIVPQWALGLWLPLPTRYTLHFGAPILPEPAVGARGPSPRILAETVRAALGELLERGLLERTRIF